MRIIGLLIALGLVASGCEVIKNGRQPLVITKATSQFYAGGVEGSPSGNQYWIHLEMQPGVQLDTIWVGELPFAITKEQVKVKEGETILAVRSETYFNDQTGTIVMNPEPSNNTPDYEGEALIIYRVENSRRIMEVDSFHRMEPAIHP